MNRVSRQCRGWVVFGLLVAAALGMPAAPAAAAGDPMRPLGAAPRPVPTDTPGLIPGAVPGLRPPTLTDPAGTLARPPAPGASANAEAAEPPAPRLLAIREDSDGRWHALVGDRWLKVGDKLGTLAVRAIDMNRLVLLDGKKISTVYLLPPLQPVEAAASAPAAPARAAIKRRPKAPPSAPGGKTPS